MCTESPIDSAGIDLQRQTLNRLGEEILPDCLALPHCSYSELHPHTAENPPARLNLQSWLPLELHREINPLLVGFGQVGHGYFHMIKPLSEPYISDSYCVAVAFRSFALLRTPSAMFASLATGGFVRVPV